MLLVGSAKKAFESYFREVHEGEEFPALKAGTNLWTAFDQVPLSMQVGVYLDWFDSVGIKIHIFLDDHDRFTYYINGEAWTDQSFQTRSLASIAALGRAIYLFNMTSLNSPVGVEVMAGAEV